MILRSFAAILLCVLGLIGCDASDNTDQADKQYSADAALVSNPERGIPVLIARLRESASLADNAIVLAGPLVPGSATVSKNSPWTIACGNGVTIYFERAEIDLVSAMVSVTDSQCAKINRRLAIELRAFTG